MSHHIYDVLSVYVLLYVVCVVVVLKYIYDKFVCFFSPVFDITRRQVGTYTEKNLKFKSKSKTTFNTTNAPFSYNFLYLRSTHFVTNFMYNVHISIELSEAGVWWVYQKMPRGHICVKYLCCYSAKVTFVYSSTHVYLDVICSKGFKNRQTSFL